MAAPASSTLESTHTKHVCISIYKLFTPYLGLHASLFVIKCRTSRLFKVLFSPYLKLFFCKYCTLSNWPAETPSRCAFTEIKGRVKTSSDCVQRGVSPTTSPHPDKPPSPVLGRAAGAAQTLPLGARPQPGALPRPRGLFPWHTAGAGPRRPLRAGSAGGTPLPRRLTALPPRPPSEDRPPAGQGSAHCGPQGPGVRGTLSPLPPSLPPPGGGTAVRRAHHGGGLSRLAGCLHATHPPAFAPTPAGRRAALPSQPRRAGRWRLRPSLSHRNTQLPLLRASRAVPALQRGFNRHKPLR